MKPHPRGPPCDYVGFLCKEVLVTLRDGKEIYLSCGEIKRLKLCDQAPCEVFL